MKKLLNFIPFFLFCATLFALSHQPDGALPYRYSNLDKEAHFVFFFLMTASVAVGLLKSRRLKGKVIFWVILILSYAIIGALDEFHQSFVPHREVSFADWCADFLGGSTFVILMLLYYRFKSFFESR